MGDTEVIRRALGLATAVALAAVIGCASESAGPPGGAPNEQVISSSSALSLAERSELLAPGGSANDKTGFSVALSKSTAVVGAPQDSSKGSAHVFVRANGSWLHEAELSASDGAFDDQLGSSVSVDGDTAVVGAPFDDDNGTDSGSVYVFVRQSGAWSEQQKLVPSDGTDAASFGATVAVSGDTALVGAPGDSAAGLSAGAVYVWTRQNGVWSQQQKLLEGDPTINSQLGFSLALSGDTALVGAHPKSVGAGAAYVFVRSNGTWSEEQKIVPDGGDNAPDNGFGYSVALSGDTGIVGAHGISDKGSHAGAGFVFVRNNGMWTQEQKLLASDGAMSDELGFSSAIYGDTALVGAPFDDNNNGANSGSVYVFMRSAGVWTETQKLLASDGVAGDRFGQPAALSGGTALFGAFLKSAGGMSPPVYDFELAKDLGEPCGSAFECHSGFCASGVCCDSICAGSCEACSVAGGASVDGACAPVSGVACNDQNPCTKTDVCQAGACIGQDPLLCPGDACNDGYCDPATGACELAPRPDGLPCASQGLCAAATTCKAGVCAAGAPKECPDLDGCHLGACDPQTGQCLLTINSKDPACIKFGAGVPCLSPSDCESGFCVEGVCCDSACDSPCSSCRLLGSPGVCSLEKLGQDLKGDCFTGNDCEATCSGVMVAPGADACVPAGKGSECSPARCQDATHSLAPAVCSAKDAPCPEPQVVACGDYGCNEVTGFCRTDCARTADCAPGQVCDPAGRCVTPPPSSSGEDASCSFAPPKRGGFSTGALAALLLGAAAWIRRRRASLSLSLGPLALAGLVGCAPEGARPSGRTEAEKVTSVREALERKQQAEVTASDGQAGDELGCAVALSGNTALIGALGDSDSGVEAGSAYVFVVSGGGWTQQQKLLGSSTKSKDWLGYSVALSGDTALVGSRTLDGDPGYAYVFERNGSVWTEEQKLLSDSPNTKDDHFGQAVALDGETALIGAFGEDTQNGKTAGSAYVFVRSGGVWIEQQKLLAADGSDNDNLGQAVALDGDTALVGALHNGENGVDAGAAYVFERSSGVWKQTAKLLASDGAAGGLFGSSVALSGDTAIVGNQNSDAAAITSAYVFRRIGGAWKEEQKLVASDGAGASWFGRSVVISGDTAVVGAYGDDNNGSDAGSAYVFVRNSGVWAEEQKLVASDGGSDDQFGYSLALSGGTALIGAPREDDKGDHSGSAYVFLPALKAPGLQCAKGYECASGYCVDAVCCDAACAGPCAACSIAKGASADGICTPQDGVACDDNNPCTQTDACAGGVCKGGDPTICPGDGCNQGLCDPAAPGDHCILVTAPDGSPCTDGDGCTMTDVCSGGVCMGTNAVSCPDMDTCRLGVCDPSAGICALAPNTEDPSCPLLDLGDKCFQHGDCKSGFCVDGVCCETGCDAPCFSCVLPGQAGACKLQSRGEDRRGDCFEGVDCVATCSGTPAGPGEDPCVPVKTGDQCAPARCLDATHSLTPALCPAPNEPCPEPTAVDCGDYRCDLVYGTCRAACVATSDCAPPLVCGPQGACIAPPPVASGDDASCSVSTAGLRAGDRAPVAALLFACAAWIERRKKRARRPDR